MPQLSDLVGVFEKNWPSHHAEEWDAVGLTVGSLSSDVSKILVAVDLTHKVIDEALAHGAQLILTHHPLLLKPVNSVAGQTLKGSLISRLIGASIAVFSAHTNADVQTDGASTAMAKAFGLTGLVPLVGANGGFGHGVLGALPAPTSLADFAKTVSKALPDTARKVVFSGSPEQEISSVAICSGAGDSFLPLVLASSADVYVTSDLRHHPALDAIATPRSGNPLALIDVSHWAAESLWVANAAHRLSSEPGLEVIVSTQKTDPWTQEVD